VDVPAFPLYAYVECTGKTSPSFIVTKADILRPFVVTAMVTLQHNFAAPVLFYVVAQLVEALRRKLEVRFMMVLLEFFTDIILLATLWARG